MSTQHILVDDAAPGVRVLTLNRPQQRNALNMALIEQLCDAIAQAEAEPACRVAILTGAGPAFCAGLDLKEAADLDRAQRGAQLVARMLKKVHDTGLVTIAAVHGSAMAGGAGLMSACDLAVASEDTRIGYPEVRRGLVAGLVMHMLLQQVGQRVARQLVLTGEPVDAGRAFDVGLVNQVVPAGQHLQAATSLAKQVLLGAPQAVMHTKQIIDELSPGNLGVALQVALDHHMAARRSDEAIEGLKAFAEKRAPAWL